MYLVEYYYIRKAVTLACLPSTEREIQAPLPRHHLQESSVFVVQTSALKLL